MCDDNHFCSLRISFEDAPALYEMEDDVTSLSLSVDVRLGAPDKLTEQEAVDIATRLLDKYIITEKPELAGQLPKSDPVQQAAERGFRSTGYAGGE